MHTQRSLPQSIIGFHQDEEGHWVAELACGHNQHVRHDLAVATTALGADRAGTSAVCGARLVLCALYRGSTNVQN